MENNIDKVMGIYCLYDKETGVYDSFIISFDDLEAKDYFVSNIALIAKDLSESGNVKNYNTFMSRLTNSCVMRLATFDKANGSFINEQVVLVDYIQEKDLIDFYKAHDELQHKFKKVSDDVDVK